MQPFPSLAWLAGKAETPNRGPESRLGEVPERVYICLLDPVSVRLVYEQNVQAARLSSPCLWPLKTCLVQGQLKTY